MGTPGEKANIIREVVKGELQNQSPSHQLHPESQVPGPSSLVVLPSALPPNYLIHQPLPQVSIVQPVVTTTPDMGVTARRLPRPPVAICEALGTNIVTATTVSHAAAAGKSEVMGHEQPTIEKYFQQSKFYPSLSEYLPPPYPSAPPPTVVKPQNLPTPLSEQPGPSGLQTPKALRTTSSTCAPSTSTTEHIAKGRKKPRQSLSTESEENTHGCNHCHRSFTSLEKLGKHQQIHSGSSPFKCEICKKTFTSKFKLVRHALIHSDRKPFSCSVCDRTFHRKDHLKNHIKVHSPQKEIFVCRKEGCKKQYTSYLSFRKHQAIHAAEEGNLTCQICNQYFQSKEDIMYHLKIHAGSRTVKNPSERKFTCDLCDRRFFTKKDVRRHNVVHTGMRDFLCQYCPQRFGRKDHLVRHIKKSHNNKYNLAETTITANVKQEPMTTKQEVLSNPCDLEIKSEFSENSLSNSEAFAPGLVDLDFLPDDLSQLDPQLFLPSTSEQVELKDLGSGILEGIEVSPPVSDDNVTIDDQNLLQQILETATGNTTSLPLPGFSQTFHSQPPPKQEPPE